MLVLHSATLREAHANMRHAILILTLALLAGCGSKGALYLPAAEEEAAPAQPPSIDEGVQLDTGDEDLEPEVGDKYYEEDEDNKK